MSTFFNALSSETHKLTSLRSTWIWAILLTGSLYGPVVLIGLFAQEKTTFAFADFPLIIMIFNILTIIFAASGTAAEYAHKMHAHAFLTQKGRNAWLAARFVVTALFLAINFAIGVAIAVVVATVMPKLTFQTVGGDKMLPMLGGLLLLGLFAAGIAAVLRSRVAGVGVPLVWILVVEPIILTFLGQHKILEFIAKYTPGLNFRSITDGVTSLGEPTKQAFAFSVLIGWAAVAMAIGLFTNKVRDVR